MRLISELTIHIKKTFLPVFINEISKLDFEINSLSIMENKDTGEVYRISVVYKEIDTFIEFINAIKKKQEKYKIISLNNLLEDQISGGMLNISGKVPVDNNNDYQMNILGAYELILKKIDDGNGLGYTGLSKNVGLITGIKNTDVPEIDYLLKKYINSEKDSILINRFSGLNAYPVVVKFDYPEDLIKTLKKIENSYSAIRLMHIDEIDISIYNQIISEIDIPVVSKALDDIPLYLLSIIVKILLKNKLKVKETTAGIIGIDVSTIKLARMLMKIGFYRILGFDQDENLMLLFEKEGGLATTTENVFNNADIIILIKSNFDTLDYTMFRPGQFIVSLIDIEDLDMDVISDRGVREFIKGNLADIAVIFPGLLKGIIESGIKSIDDNNFLELSKRLGNMLSDDYIFPDLFSDIHRIITDFFNPEIVHKKK